MSSGLASREDAGRNDTECLARDVHAELAPMLERDKMKMRGAAKAGTRMKAGWCVVRLATVPPPATT